MYRRSHVAVLFTSCLFTLSSASAQPDTLWTRTYGGPGNDHGSMSLSTSDGGVITVGWTDSWGGGLFDAWLLRLDGYGNLVWSRTFGGTGNDYGYAVAETADGSFVLSGETRSFGAGGADVWMIKVDASGNELWRKTFGGAGNEFGRAMLSTGDGGFVIGGSTNSWGAGEYDFLLLRTDSHGNPVWLRTYGGPGSDWARGMDHGPEDGFLITGYTYSYGAGNADFWLVRTDSEGVELWNRTYGGSDTDRGYSVRQIADGGFALTGLTSSFGVDFADFWLVRTDGEGSELWNSSFGGLGNDWAKCVMELPEEGFLITGSTASRGAEADDVWLLATDTSGNAVWDVTFGGPGSDSGNHVTAMPGGGFLVTGWTASFGEGGNDLWLVRTGPPLLIGGQVVEAGCWLAVYPNPGSGPLTVEAELGTASEAILTLHDVTGRVVNGQSRRLASPGRHNMTLETNGLPSGVYLVRLKTAFSTMTERFLLLR